MSQETDPESGSAQRTSARLLSEMLAEVRENGEQVVVVDQSPGQVATNVLRNTNLKVAHRIVHPDDQAAAAGAIGLELDDADLLGKPWSAGTTGRLQAYGALPAGLSRAETLELAFRCWADQGSERGRATHGTAWTELRADAGRVARPLVDCLYPQGARTPLTALEKGTWTDTLNPIRDWARREYAEKSRFLDEEWARVVLGALIHREVRAERLPASVVAAVERRVLPHS